jgi:hypothetical protein
MVQNDLIKSSIGKVKPIILTLVAYSANDFYLYESLLKDKFKYERVL